jgi:hypothetical protein
MADTFRKLDRNCLRRPGSRMAQPFGSLSRRHLRDVQGANSGNDVPKLFLKVEPGAIPETTRWSASSAAGQR